ncbi:MAG: hypothetical protein K0S34_552 [Bacillales bacterium]|jgi:hypothetical protein|nr:hypothetical protein [Bacillales bacterium]
MYYKNKTISVSDNELLVIEDYLNNNILKPQFGGKVICSFEILGSNKDNGEIYLWALTKEYYMDGNNLVMGTGSSGPIILDVEKLDKQLKVNGHLKPRDGRYYSEDIKKLFPVLIHNKIYNYPSKHFGKLNLILDTKKEELNKQFTYYEGKRFDHIKRFFFIIILNSYKFIKL